MASPEHVNYWRTTARFAWIVVVLALLLAVVVPMLTGPLDSIVVLGFPLGYYLVAQGLPVALIVLLFWFVLRQGAIDDEHS